MTGATGQIGYAITGALATTQHEVSALVRRQGARVFPDHVRVIEAGTLDAGAFAEAVADVDHVIYAIGMPEQFVFDENIFHTVNVELLDLFLKQLEDRGLTYISTYEVFEDVEGIIRESQGLADTAATTPYYRSMIEAYQLVSQVAVRPDAITTIHPAAAYGGHNTGPGFTGYIENLLQKRFWRVPFVFDGRFPLVHVDSLADAVVRSLGVPGRFIVSDEMTTLKDIARTLRKYASSYVPPTAPVSVAKLGASLLEGLSRLTRRPPVMARVQIEFITKGWEPKPDKAIGELGWQPISVEKGLERYVGASSGNGGHGEIRTADEV